MYWHRNQRDAGIKFLAEKYSSCFFEDPKLRRPLKSSIIDDLNQAGELNPEAVEQVIGWYTNHYRYKYALVAGAERVDLNGKKAGVVTLAEQMKALTQISARKQQLNERRAQTKDTEERVVISKAATNAIIAAPPTPHTASPATLHPSLSELQAAIGIINDFLTAPQFTAMCSALAAAALRSMISKAEELIDSLEGDPYEKLAVELRGDGASPLMEKKS